MVSIVWSVLSIALIIGVGWIARRGGALGPDAAGSLASATYWVASPAMLFHAIVSTGTSGVFGAPLAVAAASGFGTALLFVLVARLFLRLSRGETALGAMASSLNNGAYIGIPIAVYVLNDASAVVPILVFQLGFFTPMFFVLADLVGSGQRPSVLGVARSWCAIPWSSQRRVASCSPRRGGRCRRSSMCRRPCWVQPRPR